MKIFTPPSVVQDIINFGTSGIIGIINDNEVLKMYKPDNKESRDEIDREIKIYNIIGFNNNILKFIESTDDGIKLERMINGDVRSYIKNNNASKENRLKWCVQLCAAVTHIHNMDVFHCDINASNIFLDRRIDLKLGDFAGSCTSGMKSLVVEGVRHYLPRDDWTPTVESELFAVGSTMYEIMVGEAPYDDLDNREVEEKYKAGIFPKTDHIPCLNEVIINCWQQRYKSAKELLDNIKDNVSESNISVHL